MRTESLPATVALEGAARKPEVSAPVKTPSRGFEYLFKFLIIIVAGIFLGAIAAFIIGLLAGWLLVIDC